MKRYLTINVKDLNEVLVLIQNMAAVVKTGNEAVVWITKKFNEKDIAYADKYAEHHTHLPNQNGVVSFYWVDDDGGTWTYVKH